MIDTVRLDAHPSSTSLAAAGGPAKVQSAGSFPPGAGVRRVDGADPFAVLLSGDGGWLQTRSWLG